jgi:hypothetical protein
MNATYVSIWDGDTEVRTSCKFNPETKQATDIESTDDVQELDMLMEEYIELPTGDIVKTFTTDCGRKVVDGQLDESIED